MKTILVFNFRLDFDPSDGWREVSFDSTSRGHLCALVRALSQLRRLDAILASNPHLTELLFIWAAKRLSFGRIQTYVFDLILRRPASFTDRLLALVRRRLLSAVDTFFCIHKDVSGYTKHFGVPPQRCSYIPFKANNFDLSRRIPSQDGDYILALGASHRDYTTLIKAVRDTGITTTILLPRESIALHNARLGTSLPPNVNHIDVAVSREEWSQYIANSRLVVVPLMPGVLQPAGISVYLEAMIFGKPVVISRGSSTDGILDESVAALVAAGDAEQMRMAIVSLWNDKDRRLAMGDRARQYAQGLGTHERLVRDIRKAVVSLAG